MYQGRPSETIIAITTRRMIPAANDKTRDFSIAASSLPASLQSRSCAPELLQFLIRQKG
jgi:hypothetical protein